MFEFDINILFVCFFAFFAGLIDAAVGGGGLIQFPAVMNFLPANSSNALIAGTNKFASAIGTASATRAYVRKVKLPWRLILPVAATAFGCSFLGATVVSWISNAAFRPLVLGLLIIMLFYTLKKKDFGGQHQPIHIGKKQILVGLSIGGAIGFYDGFFGPGTGSFLMFLFIRFFAFDFLHASAAAKVVNLATNLAALTLFLPQGNVLFLYAIPMAICNLSGAIIGSHLAMKNGSKFVRVLFIFLSLSLIAKLAFDIWKA